MRTFLLLLRLRALLLQLLPLELRPSVLKPNFYLSFCEAKAVRELFPLGSYDIMVFLKGVLESQQLRRGESRPNTLGFSSQRVVQKETLRTRFISLEAMAQVSVSVQEPGVEGGGVPLLGEQWVRAVRGGQGVPGQGVRRGHRVHRDSRAGRMRHRLGEHQVRVGVDASGGRVEAVEEGVHLARVGVAQRRGPDGLLGPGRRHRTVLGHEGLYRKTPLGCWLEHGLVIVQVPQFKFELESRSENTPQREEEEAKLVR